MIEARVFRYPPGCRDPQGEPLMVRTFYEPNLTLEDAVVLLESYIVGEGLNLEGECLVRARFGSLSRSKP